MTMQDDMGHTTGREKDKMEMKTEIFVGRILRALEF